MLRGVFIAAAFAIALPSPSAAAAKPPFIAVSNAYYGNNWRRQMVDAFRKAADQAKKDKLISGYVVLNGDNSGREEILAILNAHAVEAAASARPVSRPQRRAKQIGAE